LPQHRDQFLNAVASNGKPDFTVRQRIEAKELLASDHIIQEQVVANSPDRTTQFEEANVEIMHVSDALVCLLRAESDGRRGGTHQLLDRAIQRGMPVLEIRISENNRQLVVVKDEWHNIHEKTYDPPKNLPQEIAELGLPTDFGGGSIPSREPYCDALNDQTRKRAGRLQRIFKVAAAITITTHVAATVLAALALAMHDFFSLWLSLAILLFELGLLVAGFAVHNIIHHSRMVEKWAISRVISELMRSLRAIGSRHIYLEHFFRLQLPHRYRPLLRTLSVLHLHATRSERDKPWEPQREQYIDERFDDPINGQIPFFELALRKDQQVMTVCQWTFFVCSLLAMAATGYKIFLLWDHSCAKILLAAVGGLAVTLPVLAVGGLSWAAAVDCEARVETFGEVLEFLRRQRPLLQQAASASEFDRLLLETETILLGEITSWYARRSSKGVS
jgi:hypothetical protein